MTTATGTSVSRRVQRAGHGEWAERLGRIGFATRGVLYLIVGVLAIQIASRHSANRTDRTGALEVVARQPLGRVLLVLVAAGMAAYAIWRLSVAVFDRGHAGDDPKGLAKRARHLGTGVVYLSGCATAIRLLLAHKADANTQVDWTARVLGWPGGRWLVAAVGIAVVGAGVASIVSGVTKKFAEKLERAPERAVYLGIVGKAGRGLAFVLVGIFVIKAAITFDPNEAQGLDVTLKNLAATNYGPFLVLIVAVGLIAFGLYSFVEARFRRVE